MIQSVLSSARVRSGDPPTYFLKVCGDGGFLSNDEIHKKREREREREIESGKERIGNVPDKKKRKHNESSSTINSTRASKPAHMSGADFLDQQMNDVVAEWWWSC
jgi:hypothetical protein